MNIYWCWSVQRPTSNKSCFSKNYYIYNNVRAILLYYYIFIKNRINWTLDVGRVALCWIKNSVLFSKTPIRFSFAFCKDFGKPSSSIKNTQTFSCNPLLGCCTFASARTKTAYPQPLPKGGGLYPFGGQGTANWDRLNEDNAPLRLSDEERVDRSQLQMTNRHTGMAPTNEWAHILNKLNERTN